MPKKHKPHKKISKPAQLAIREAKKELDPLAPLDLECQLLLPAKVSLLVEELASRYLASNKNDQPSRDLIGRLAFALRQETLAKFGHDSVETIKLSSLLDSANKAQSGLSRPGRFDSITHIQNYSNRLARLDSNQEEAASYIIRIWQGFSKFRDFVGGGLKEGGGGRSQVLGPVDVMGQDLWEHHRKVYTPWHAIANRALIPRRVTGGSISIASLTFKILWQDIYPEDLEQSWALSAGMGLKALKAGLNAYFQPELLNSWLAPPANACPSQK